jgi:hypothetical protein
MKYKQTWYSIINKHKFIPPTDKTMKGFKIVNESVQVFSRSSYELRAFRYADSNPAITKWSAEPFAIHYVKPTDFKKHRYFVDMYLEFVSGDKYLVEIKPYNETQPPKTPKRKTPKSEVNFKKAQETYAINQCKWEAAKHFAAQNNMKFIILTEKELFG